MDLPSIEIFNIDSGTNTGLNWRNWLDRFENYMIALNITNDQRKAALLLHAAGKRVFNIYQTLKDVNDNYSLVKKKLTEFFNPKSQTLLSTYQFMAAQQLEHETIDLYTSRLRTMATECDFADADKFCTNYFKHASLKSSVK